MSKGTYIELCASRRNLIKEAVEKQVVFTEGGEGTETHPASPTEISDFILSMYDDAVYNLMQNTACVSALRRFCEEKKISPFKQFDSYHYLYKEEKKKLADLYPAFAREDN